MLHLSTFTLPEPGTLGTMENFFSRYRNETVLVGVLFAQIVGLATQLRVAAPTEAAGKAASVPVIRVWAFSIIAPFEKLAVHTGHGVREMWHGYVDLRDARKRNEQLQQELNQIKLEHARLQQDAEQARRLQALLAFKEQFLSKTLAAQVIGTSGTGISSVIYIDRGSLDGVRPGMAVITPDGIVGKVLRADTRESQVLLINDSTSGAGVLIERLRLNGVLRGEAGGRLGVLNVMSDEPVQAGDRVITSGGDRVFPKGVSVGTVVRAVSDPDRAPFLAIEIKPAVNLQRLEEVLVVVEMASVQTQSAEADGVPLRAADVLAQRLPTARKPVAADVKAGAALSPVATLPGKPGAGSAQRLTEGKRTTSAQSSGVSTEGATAKKKPDTEPAKEDPR